MFDDFIENGSILAVALLVYTCNVMIEAMTRAHRDPYGVNSPTIIRGTFSSIVMIVSLPCAVWPAIYIGIWSGWVAGLVSWIGLQLIGAMGTMVLGIRGPALGIHFVLACVAYPVGMYLSISSL